MNSESHLALHVFEFVELLLLQHAHQVVSQAFQMLLIKALQSLFKIITVELEDVDTTDCVSQLVRFFCKILKRLKIVIITVNKRF